MSTTNKEQLIRVKILPQLESLSDHLFDYYKEIQPHIRALDRITQELIEILNEE